MAEEKGEGGGKKRLVANFGRIQREREVDTPISFTRLTGRAGTVLISRRFLLYLAQVIKRCLKWLFDEEKIRERGELCKEELSPEVNSDLL